MEFLDEIKSIFAIGKAQKDAEQDDKVRKEISEIKELIKSKARSGSNSLWRVRLEPGTINHLKTLGLSVRISCGHYIIEGWEEV